MQTITVKTSQREEVLDLTAAVDSALAGRGEGVACVSVAHCTCGLYLNENESGLVEDTLGLLRELTAAQSWRHDRIDDNARAHLAATLLGNAVLLPCRGGRLVLGTWQRLMLVELDGPRQRQITVALLREGGEPG
jgi:secondary thiamine-phosphate synthase enzyme